MEVWKNIKGYEGLYQVSNLGRIKGLERVVSHSLKGMITLKERILKTGLTSGYLHVSLCKGGKAKTHKVHQLLAITFLNHIPNGNKIICDHIDNNQLNNRLENLQLITQRENNSKDKKGTSKYIGVSWVKDRNKWQAEIMINGKKKFLGRFKTELQAAAAYQKELELITNLVAV